jgi:hypothetical protein
VTVGPPLHSVGNAVMRLARERGEVHPERLEDLARVPLEPRQLLGLDLPTPHPLPVGAVLFGRVTEVAQGAPSGSLLMVCDSSSMS